MTSLVGHFLRDYARNGLNLLLLAVVPVVFVLVAADTMAEAARLLGGAGGGSGVETVTAGWAAAFLSAIAMYFQVSAAGETDRRLVLAGLPRRRLVGARLATGGLLAALAAAAALVALALGPGIGDAPRVVAGTAMFAVIYLAFGAVAGATIPSAVNGTVVLMFVWILDVFFGPTLSDSESVVTRVLPTHFVSLWTVNLPAGHGGLSELAWSLAWTAAALVLAFVMVSRQSRVAPARHAAWRRTHLTQLGTGLRMAWHEWRRAPVLWVLLAVVPAVFIWLSDVITPHGSTPVTLKEDGATYTAMLDPAHMHAGMMTPMAVGSLAALAGIFVVLDARSADQRLVLAGQRPGVVTTTRLGMVMSAALVAVAASITVTAAVFEPHQWLPYAAALVLVAVTYGLVGVLIGPLFGRVGGAFMAFLLPFLDLSIGQSPMLRGEPTGWAQYLPGFGTVRVLVDGALTETFDERGALWLALGWVAGLLVVATVLLRRVSATST